MGMCFLFIIIFKMQLALCIHTPGANQLELEIFRKKPPESSKKQNLNLLCTKHYAEYIQIHVEAHPAVAHM